MHIDALNIGKAETSNHVNAPILIFDFATKWVATMSFKLNTNDTRMIINALIYWLLQRQKVNNEQ